MQVNHHPLADFRSLQGEALDGLLSEHVASLMAAGVVKLKSVAQDGLRVRASAGAASFRREAKLKGYLDAARAQVAALKQAVEDDPSAEFRRRKAARERAAEEARASTTDAEATVMKRGDGGFRPAYNLEFGSDTESRIIVGVDVATTGSDMAQMVDQVIERCGVAPENWLVDGGFPAHDQVEAVAEQTRVIAPVPRPKARCKDKTSDQGDSGGQGTGDGGSAAPAVDPHQRKPGDGEAVGAWRERMGAAEARALYKERAAVAECVNAQARNRNLVLLPVRGLKKVRAVATLYALAHNLMRMISLAPELFGTGTSTSEIRPMAA